MLRKSSSDRVGILILLGLIILAAPILSVGWLSANALPSTEDNEIAQRPAKAEATVSRALAKNQQGDMDLSKRGAANKNEIFREETGSLSEEDETLDEGEFFDEFEFEAEEGQTVVIDLLSDDFDTYLYLSSSLDEDFDIQNDDYRDLTTRSQIEFTVPESGNYVVGVTSYESDEMGDYTLTFSTVEVRVEEGELVQGDEELDSGEFVDWYEVEGHLGEMGVFQLTSSGFDTYLILEDPDGFSIHNDDYRGSTAESQIESDFLQEGIYRIGVTSFDPEETGDYVLRIRSQEGIEYEEVADSGELERELSGDEVTLADGSYADGYSFVAEEGNTVIVEMRSDDFDTYLKIRGPGGMDESNDDAEGETDSRIAFRVRETGRYQITATSYKSGDSGDYAIEFHLDATKYDAGKWAVGPEGKVFGVFVGISDYPGGGDLAYCDKDAERAYAVMKRKFGMSARNSVLLVNEEATYDNVSEAVQRIAAAAGPDDMFVFFYSGHGNQQKRQEADNFDPDGFDETLGLYDNEMTDDYFAGLLDECQAGTCLMVLDSCFSGGFARDVICEPGRIGIFSSEGDCLSLVAEKHGAGGYLSLFFNRAFRKDRNAVDFNNDRMITVHELTFYLQMQFHDIVQSENSSRMSMLFPEGPIDPGDNLGFQRILSDRDGVSPHLILLDW